MLEADGEEVRQPPQPLCPGATVLMNIPQLSFPLAASTFTSRPHIRLKIPKRGKTSLFFFANSVKPIFSFHNQNNAKHL